MFLSVMGLYDVEYQVSVAARDACIYTIKGGGRTPKYRFALGSQPCGMQRVDKELVVGCMDQTLSCFTVKVSEGLWHTRTFVSSSLIQMSFNIISSLVILFVAL